jgi:hypothetical protein
VERATRIELAFSAWEKKGGQAYDGELERTIMAGRSVIYTPTNSHERQRSREIRGIKPCC